MMKDPPGWSFGNEETSLSKQMKHKARIIFKNNMVTPVSNIDHFLCCHPFQALLTPTVIQTEKVSNTDILYSLT